MEFCSLGQKVFPDRCAALQNDGRTHGKKKTGKIVAVARKSSLTGVPPCKMTEGHMANKERKAYKHSIMAFAR